ncbi:Asp-tRNA(Asn)/Glu-tRNA(Gln) amidotransferase A subunit family amidase [Rhodopseudomonas julia]|uniref:Asp-tRNA(Asn)/Glu-tRNA(Gln) amidotransferase A subunit family amidase n=1 Tax=Rhodopseudomonas julia TaxID=200617 RepID=A0ABU0C7G0_9BRAD|nr:amidase [Rhodopseudomonas julia]MDQ0326446.1 Asp-tRNA(Asn)/Glu-tRNA(Gln) amidotransferase A subunit family amidase [Rhodopseudomonas julia]
MTAERTLDACELRDRIARGEISALAVAEACLARVAEKEGEIEAFAFLDADHVLAQAQRLDDWRKAGKPIGRLHGLPVGLKDIIDTADMPTENGTVLDAGRRPRQDAFVAAKLRAEGAVLFGKTTTTELAYFAPTKTHNPHDTTRTPGGSSAGSAASVAAGMVPLSVGTQTNGSMLRPASYCGVVGFKPGHGVIPRTGLIVQSEPLDTIGVFGRSVEDTALLAEVLQGYDAGDHDTHPIARDRLLETARSAPPVKPQFAFIKTPVWDKADADMQGAMQELAGLLGDQCDEVELPAAFANAHPAHRRLMMAGFARNLRPWAERGWDQLSRHMQDAIDEGREIKAVDYLAALDWRNILNAGLDRVFARYDAILTPAAPGEAPADLTTTGDPVFNTIWSLCGVPALSLPLANGANGMPLGIQIVGARGQEGRLLRTARWLMDHVAASPEPEERS